MKEKLNPLQENFLEYVKLLQSLNYPIDLFDNLYKENFNSK
jgi:hypothetical protein